MCPRASSHCTRTRMHPDPRRRGGGRIAPLHSGHCGITVLCERYERKRDKDMCESRFVLETIRKAVPASRDKRIFRKQMQNI